MESKELIKENTEDKKQTLREKIFSTITGMENDGKLMSFFNDDKEKIARFKLAILNIANNQSLSKCTASSVLSSAFNLAETGLEINPILNQCYIVKYKNDAEPIISYKGWQSLAEKSGKRVKAFSIFKCDKFEIDLSEFDENITFIPNLDERQESNDKWYKENLKGVLVKIKDLKDGYVKNSFISVNKINKIKGLSPSSKSDYSPYNTWAEEMYLAKAIKYVLSREALNFKDDNLAKAIQVDNQLDMKLQQDNKEVKKDDIESII